MNEKITGISFYAVIKPDDDLKEKIEQYNDLLKKSEKE